MVILAALAAAAAAPQRAPERPTGATVQARAIVRVISGVELRLGAERANRDGFVRRDSIVRSAGGTQPAKLIEFQ